MRLVLWSGAALLAFASPAARAHVLVHDPANGSPFRDLQEVLDVAVDGDTVLVGPGEHILDRPLEWDPRHDPDDPESPPPRAITLRSMEGPEATWIRLAEVLEGAPEPERASVIVFRRGVGPATVLEGFTITGGRGTLLEPDPRCAEGEPCRGGGGILVEGGASPTFMNLRVTGNSALIGGGILCAPAASPAIRACLVEKNIGGGIYLLRASATIEDCTVRENYAAWNAGGGGLTCIASSPAVTRSTFDANKTDDDGGGAHLDEGSDAVFTECLFTRNSAGHYTFGMGIYCRASSPRIVNCRFIENSWADYSAGGGLYCEAGAAPIITGSVFSGNVLSCGSGGGFFARDASPVITDCSFTGNSVDNGENGGAVCITGASSPVIRDCTIRHNLADRGGAIYCGPGSTPEISGTWILENHARAAGGGIAADEASPRIVHSTVVGNTAVLGGSAFHALRTGGVHLMSSIVHDNPGLAVLLEEGGSLAVTHSAIDEGWPGEGNTAEAPLFFGWGDASEVHVAASPGEPGGDGSAENPFGRLEDALAYSFVLSPASPCIGSAHDGSDMGAPAGRSAASPSAATRKVLVGPGTFQAGVISLFHRASLVGSGAAYTVIEGTVRGLRTGAVLSDLTVARGRYAGVEVFPGESPEIARCVIRECSGPGLDLDGASPRVTDCEIAENRAEYLSNPGGGISARSGASPAVLRTTIARNDGNYSAGGIHLAMSGGTFTDCRILENVTRGFGGGIHADRSTASFERCVIGGNSAQDGSGIDSQDSADTFTNCIIWGNEASPAVNVKYKEGTTVFRNCTIAFNEGGGFECTGGSPRILSSIIWGNAGLALIRYGDAVVTVSHSCIEGIAWEGEGNLTDDPLLDRVVPGDPWDLRLGEGSPAIDSGDALDAPADDLDGNARPCGGGIDMGAHERCGDDIPGALFRRGHADPEASLDISDAISILRFLFSGDAEIDCLDAADADDSGEVDITDPIWVLDHLFLGGNAPPAPGPSECGLDPTVDILGCAAPADCS